MLSRPYRVAAGFRARQSSSFDFGARASLALTVDGFNAASGWADSSSAGNSFVGATEHAEVATVSSISAVSFPGTGVLEGGPLLSTLMDASGRWYGAAIMHSRQVGTTPVGTGVFAPDSGANAMPAGIVLDGFGGNNRYGQVLHTAANGSGWSGIGTGTDSANGWRLVEWGNNGSTVRIRVRSSSALVYEGFNGASGAPHTRAVTMRLGGATENSTQTLWNGAVAFLVVFSGVPNATDMALVRSYCLSEFGFADSGSNLFT
jgi:hypothetical protein